MTPDCSNRRIVAVDRYLKNWRRWRHTSLNSGPRPKSGQNLKPGFFPPIDKVASGCRETSEAGLTHVLGDRPAHSFSLCAGRSLIEIIDQFSLGSRGD
jgi:hypothetical protein